jgi:hypothetical protein
MQLKGLPPYKGTHLPVSLDPFIANRLPFAFVNFAPFV